MKMEKTVSSETSVYKIQKPGYCPEESIQHSEQGESLKSGIINNVVVVKGEKESQIGRNRIIWKYNPAARRINTFN
jgi:hypothetical protein